jgi:putative FmdB family regulatory protein
MPIYEFECPICHDVGEEYFGMDERKLLHCDVCGVPMNRIYSAPMIGGDLPSRWAHRSYEFGRDFSDRTEFERAMASRDRVLYEPDHDIDPHKKEIRKIRDGRRASREEIKEAKAIECEACSVMAKKAQKNTRSFKDSVEKTLRELPD